MLAQIEGAEALDARLAQLGAGLQALVDGKARALAERLAAKVRDEKLSGQVLQARSGALKASITAEVSASGDGVSATVGSGGDVKYAAIQEYGGRTSAHDILPDKAAALAFMSGGGLRFARSVRHPESTLPARAYLSSALGEMQDEIVGELTDAARRAWEAQ